MFGFGLQRPDRDLDAQLRVEIEMRFLTLSAIVCGVCVLLLVRAMLLKGAKKAEQIGGCGFISLRAIVSYPTLPIV